MSEATRWADSLNGWAIPDEILAVAPESPWGFPLEVFVGGARRALMADHTPTHRRAVEVLPEGGVVLDVGSGAGAASLPIAPPAGRIVAVDEDRRMLDALADLATGQVTVSPVEGSWPDVAADAGVADVVVCANVVYNVADIAPFLEALTRAARGRVVVEMTDVHPQTATSPLWAYFWGLPRPAGPTSGDLHAVVREVLGVTPSLETWERPGLLGERDAGTVARVRRRLCLPETRDGEVAAELERIPDLAPSSMVTMWWPGKAAS